MTTDALFDGFDDAVAPEKLTAGERRRRRQQAAIDRGQHPLSLLFGYMPLAANESATCGKCVHRVNRHGGAKSYPKCDIPGRDSRSEASDVRAWWPACKEFEPKDVTS